MRPIPVQKARFRQKRDVMMLDDSSMVLELTDLAETTTLKDRRPPASAAPVQPQSYDFLTELYSAASMIMDREECEALEKEIAQMKQTKLSHSVAA
jgi:hypothetical protein